MDEVLIIGKVEAGKLKFDPQLLDLNLFCHNLLEEIKLSYFDCQKINFVNQTNCTTILADQNLLKLVLVNLLGNAIKYSPAESIIEFTVCNDGEQIVLKIADRGIGIPLEEQGKIFEPFHRGNNVGDLPGNGLGLAIAKKIVELQSGQIFLAKEVDVGSTFVVKIPLKLRKSKINLNKFNLKA
jgi:signal transduction histidine kinase